MNHALRDYLSSINDCSRAVIKAKAFAFVLEHMRFTIDEHDWFPCFYNWNRPINFFTVDRWKAEIYGENSPIPVSLLTFKKEYAESGDVVSYLDCDHSVPDWYALYELGFPGVKERAQKYRNEHGFLTELETGFYESIDIAYDAILHLLERMADYARVCTFEKAPYITRALDNLRAGAPTDTYERLMLIYIYFMLSESVDSFQVRSLGSGLD